VYHLLLHGPIHDLGVSFGIAWQREGFLHGAVTVVATLVVASLSWHLMERPISALKDRFTYGHRSRRTRSRNEDIPAAGLQASRAVPVLTARQ
jgi:peptidoglycan/LPS O-acetylase OafA/YrhL